MPNPPPKDSLAEHPIGTDPGRRSSRRPETLDLFSDIGETPLTKEAPGAESPPQRSRPPHRDAEPAATEGPLGAAETTLEFADRGEDDLSISFARRIVSGLADLLILALVGAVELGAAALFLELRFPPPALVGFAAFLVLVALVLLVLVPFVWGTTPGMALADLRVVASDGGSPTLAASFLRFLGFALTGLLAGVPLLVVAFDRRGRTLADLFSRTSLVPDRRRQDPERVG